MLRTLTQPLPKGEELTPGTDTKPSLTVGLLPRYFTRLDRVVAMPASDKRASALIRCRIDRT